MKTPFALWTSAACISLLSILACTNEENPGDRGGSADAGPGTSATGTYASKCNLACTPVKSCSKQDPSSCVSDCVTLTEGLSATCAQCVTEHSHWNGTYCEPNGAKCNIGSDCFGACTPADESCLGYEIAKTTDSACAAACK